MTNETAVLESLLGCTFPQLVEGTARVHIHPRDQASKAPHLDRGPHDVADEGQWADEIDDPAVKILLAEIDETLIAARIVPQPQTSTCGRQAHTICEPRRAA
jgi:hypothetical protein